MPEIIFHLEPVFLAFLLVPALVTIHVALFRRRKENGLAYVQLPLVFGCYALLWLVVFSLLPGDKILADYIGGLCAVGFCCLAYAQVFSITVRGFSLRILGDIAEKGALDFQQIMDGYGGGRGLDWMFEKRITGMESLHLVQRQDGTLSLRKPLGLLAGWLGIYTKAVLKIGAGG